MTALNSEGLEKAWRFDIQYGPDGEANYAWVYNGKDLVATMRTRYADSIVEAMNRRAPLSSLPGEAEVVAWVDAGTIDLPWEKKIVATNPEYVKRNGGLGQFQPLVTPASLQAIQARAEKAERERDEARAEIERMTPKFVAYEYLESPAGREAAEARVKELEEALKPFADVDALEHAHLPDETPVAIRHELLLDLTLRLGHFRSARTALTGGSNG